MIHHKLLTRMVHAVLVLALAGAWLGGIASPPTHAAPTTSTYNKELDLISSPEPPATNTMTLPASNQTGQSGRGTRAPDAAGAMWSLETIDNGAGVGNYASLAIDPSGRYHVSYYDQPNMALKYAQWTGVAWNTSTVDNSAAVGQYTSLDTDGSYYPHISYYDQSNTALKHAYWGGSSWISETVDNSAAVGRATSLACDATEVYISYQDQSNAALKYAHWNGSSWISDTVDNGVAVGTSTALAMRGSVPQCHQPQFAVRRLHHRLLECIRTQRAGPRPRVHLDGDGFGRL